MLDDKTFHVLNAVHLKKTAKAAQVAAITGVPAAEVETMLADAVSQERAMDMDGTFMLLPDGTQAVLDFYNEKYAGLRADAALEAWYGRFESLNADFIKQVSDYQGSGGERAQGRLMKIVERLIKALGDIIPKIPRYEEYVRRFEAGLAKIDDGKLDFIASPTIDSVHNIWFEFHEDILSVLGRPRDT